MRFFTFPLLLVVGVVGLTGLRAPQLLPTKLEITVRNELGNVETGATVEVYATQAGYDARQKPLGKAQTDAKGRATFGDLAAVAYFVHAENGDRDNAGAGVKTIPLVAKRTNKITLIIE